MTFARKLISVAGAAAFWACGLTAASASTFNFTDVDGVGSGVAFESQVSLNVVTSGAKIGFEIINDALGATAGVIEQVNFDDALGLLAAFDSFINIVGGVDFKEDLKNLPEGNSVGFVSAFGFQANPPPPKNGIQPGDALTILFDVNAGVTQADIETALGNGDLKLGIHVIAFADGSSDTLLSGPPSVVPLPAGGMLLLFGLGALTVARRKRA